MKETDEEIKCDVVSVFRSDPIDASNRVDLRVVKWSTGKERVLEKRRVWVTSSGELRSRKMIGLSSSDVDFIVGHAEEIKKSLAG